MALTCELNNNGQAKSEYPAENLLGENLLFKQNASMTTLSSYPPPPPTHTDCPKWLIPEICKQFYTNGWVSGTGGGMSIRQNGLIYCAPSGVQKERLKPEDIFVLNDDGVIMERPSNANLKCSECLALFMLPYRIRNAGCCLHSHSSNANLITSLCDKLSKDKQQQQKYQVNNNNHASNGKQLADPSQHLEFRIKNQEMIKGIKRGSSGQCMNYNDTLVVPIIENSLYEGDLVGAMGEAINKYPLTNAILVKNHGLYVWGRTWMEAKTMAECYDYLFRIKLEAYKFGLDWMIED